jgi:hypothetical protein
MSRDSLTTTPSMCQHHTTSTFGNGELILFTNHYRDSRMIEGRIIVPETARMVILPIMSPTLLDILCSYEY